MDGMWDDSDHKAMAMKVAMERFAMNSVAGQFAPPTWVDKMLTQVPANRFDYGKRIVVDNENLNLFEPFATCLFTLSQVSEFAAATGDAAMQTRVMTTITRSASALARWHDVLFFYGLEDDPKTGGPVKLPPGVKLGPYLKAGDPNTPLGLRQAARAAELEIPAEKDPIYVGSSRPDGTVPLLNEDLVTAAYKAVLRLEGRGYYTTYHLILGQRLWEELHRPTRGSLVLPRDRIEPTLQGGTFHRTTTIPDKEALLASLDGPTFDCVIAADSNAHPGFEVLPTEVDGQTIYRARIVERFAPRIREYRAIVRLEIDPDWPPALPTGPAARVGPPAKI
jgi:hypothetical protein